MATRMPQYIIRVYSRNFATDFGKDAMILDIHNAKNLGYADYINDVPEAFFTLMAEDPQVSNLRDDIGAAIVEIVRIEGSDQAVVWSGFLGTEVDATSHDVVFYCHGFLSALYWLHTDWESTWTTKQINEIVLDVWNEAKFGIANTEVNWVQTGTIEAPVTTSGGATPIVLPKFQTYYRPLLFVLRDLSAIARSDTTNVVKFEIDHIEPNPTLNDAHFNFYKNYGSDKTLAFQWGHEIQDYHHLYQPANRVNRVLAVGSSPRNSIMRTVQEASPGVYGRKQAALYLSWVRDQTELERVAKERLAKGNRWEKQLNIGFYPGKVPPPPVNAGTVSEWRLGDRVKVLIDRGITNINEHMLVSGYQVTFTHGTERMRMMLEDRSGT